MKKKYTAFPNFVFRTPLLPVRALDEREKLSETQAFQEALFLASPEFFQSEQFTRDDDKKTKKRDISLYKYFSRACTRCTPFGLFAGCSVGEIGEETAIELVPMNQYTRCTRLDMQYLCALIQKFENEPRIRKQLRFYPNDSLYEIGGKLRYVEYHYKKTKRIHQILAVESSEYLLRLFERARTGARMDQLAEILVDEDITHEEAMEFVAEVIDSQLLKSELDPSVVGDDVLSVLIDKLSQLEQVEELPVLQEIRSGLEEIDRMPLGTSLGRYDSVIGLIRRFGIEFEPKFLFQTDLFKPAAKAVVSGSLMDEIQDIVLFLTALSHPAKHSNLESFREAFSNRYEERAVPLMEVLDNELGLGYPYNASGNSDVNPLIDDMMLPGRSQPSNQIGFTPIDAILLRKYVKCMQEGKNEIILESGDFDVPPEKASIPDEYLSDTLSVMCSLISGSPDKTEIYLKGVNNSGGANLLGRFCHLDPVLEGLVRSVGQKESENHPDAIVAEISHLPESRIGNIASRPFCRDYVIHYLSNSDVDPDQRIPASDLMLSVRRGRLTLTSRKYGKEVIPRLTCAHNHSISPIPVYRFLCDMQSLQRTRLLNLSYGEVFSHFDYQPRLRYRNVILSRQRWSVKKEEIKEAEKLEGEALLEFFNTWRTGRKMPRWVVYPESDNEMFVDMQDEQSIQTFLSQIKKRNSFPLEEFLFDPEEAPVREGGQRFSNEMIFIFHK